MGEPNLVSKKLGLIIEELVTTETSYIADLDGVLGGYARLFDSYSGDRVFALMRSSLQKLVEFSRELLVNIKQESGDAVKVCQVFSKKTADFNEHYGNYCDIYPVVMTILENVDPASGIAQLIGECMKESGFALPLGSYLLKPVQRVLRYHLLLTGIRKSNVLSEEDKVVVQTCVDKMKSVNDTINEKKRIQEGYAQLPVLRSKIINLKEALDFELAGPVVMQCQMKVNGKKRHVVLFENVLLFMRITEDGEYAVTEGLAMANLLLSERNSKGDFSFDVKEHQSSKQQFTLTLKSLDLKEQWVLHVKRMILQNMKVNLNEQKLAALFGENVASKMQTLLSVHDLASLESHINTSRHRVDTTKDDATGDHKAENSQIKDGAAKRKCGKLFDLEKLLGKPCVDRRGSFCVNKVRPKPGTGDIGSDSISENVPVSAKDQSVTSTSSNEPGTQARASSGNEQTGENKGTSPLAIEGEIRLRKRVPLNSRTCRRDGDMAYGFSMEVLKEMMVKHESFGRLSAEDEGGELESPTLPSVSSCQVKPQLPKKSTLVRKLNIRAYSPSRSFRQKPSGGEHVASVFHYKETLDTPQLSPAEAKPDNASRADSHATGSTFTYAEVGIEVGVGADVSSREKVGWVDPFSGLSPYASPTILFCGDQLVKESGEDRNQAFDTHVESPVNENDQEREFAPSSSSKGLVSVPISKSSRIGNILRQLQHQCMISESKFKRSSNIIKIGKFGVPVVDLPEDSNNSPQPPSERDLTRPDS